MALRTVLVALALGAGCAHKPMAAEQAHEPATAVAVGAQAPDAQLAQASGVQVALADVLHQHARTIVVFYRGFWWHSCVSWLGELADHAAALDHRDVGIVAIAADSVADMASLQTRLPGLTLLTDPDHVASAAWGVQVAGADNPSPGTFVVGRDGAVRWRRLEDKLGDWPTYAELAAALP